jgi:hypothetical protein
MAPRTDFLTQQRRRIDARLQELRPAHEEYLTLLEAKEALDGLKAPSQTGRPPGRTPGRRGPGRPPGSGTKRRSSSAARGRAPSSNGRRRARRGGTRRRAGGTRADQALALIKSSPGVTVPEIADRMGIRQNYLYRVTAALQKQGSVKRKGQGFVAA